MNCVNCRIATDRSNAIGNVMLKDQAVFSIIKEWTGLQTLAKEHHVCSSCWYLANEALRARQQGVASPPTVGHRSVCVSCGRSILRARSHSLNTSTERIARIHSIISEWILPNRVENTSKICHCCWVKADKKSRHLSPEHITLAPDLLPESSPSPPENKVEDILNIVDNIVLPNYRRTRETESECFIESCHRQEQYTIPISFRKTMLEKYNFYIPPNNCLCDQHILTNSLELHKLALDHSSNIFTADHIQDMLSLNSSMYNIDSIKNE